jgi:hypothetical protein
VGSEAFWSIPAFNGAPRECPGFPEIEKHATIMLRAFGESYLGATFGGFRHMREKLLEWFSWIDKNRVLATWVAVAVIALILITRILLPF